MTADVAQADEGARRARRRGAPPPPGLGDFAGRWHVARRIVHADGSHARFRGSAVFTPEGGGLLHAETGLLWPGSAAAGVAPIRAERRYRWQPGPEGTIAVFFADGRPFHRFDPALPLPEARHPCGADLYEVRYAFGRWPRWWSRWRVRGPRKDYVMLTIYSPAGEEDGRGE
ncbi:MAG: DUF6314 family protein [Roseovarius sp.]